MDGNSESNGKDQPAGNQQIITQSATFERSKKSGAVAQPQRVHKKTQAKFIQNRRHFQIGVQRAKGNPNKQHGGNPQTGAPNRQFAKWVPNGCHQEQQ